MTTTPVEQARAGLGARLQEIRKDAGLTGRALAALCQWHFTKVSKLEHGTRRATEDDIRAWCVACSAGDQVPDLLATVRAIESMYVEWHRQMRAGLKQSQVTGAALYERTKLFRIYENTVLPGLFNTAGYAAAILRFWMDFLKLPNDIDDAVAVRMERQRVLYSGDHRFVVVLEEQTLRTLVSDAEVMSEQLDRLLAVMSLPRVSVGIVPGGGPRYSLAQGSFWIFDEDRVQVEHASAGLDITQPREVAIYARVFALLQQSAVYGPAARALVHGALAALGSDAQGSDST